MKRTSIFSFIGIGMISLFFICTPCVFSQFENVEVLSHTGYVSSYGNFIVVGEAQNTGSTNIEYIALRGYAYSQNGEPQAISQTTVFSNEILPQHKAPFIMYFFPESSLNDDYNWLSNGVDHVEFEIINATTTQNYQYPHLEIINDFSYIDSNGVYTINGTVRNTGDQAAGRMWIVATFYNSTGHVIATDFSDYLTPDSLEADQTTSFSLTNTAAIPEMVNEMTQLSSEIAGYSLIIQLEAPIIPEFPSWIILPLLLVTTFIVIICPKKLNASAI